MRDRIRAEINEVLDRLAKKEETWVPRWIAQEVVGSHANGIADDGEDADFIRYCAYAHTRAEVAAVIRKRADPSKAADTDQLLLMEGWDHLQQYYTVEREGDWVAEPTTQCTDKELLAKASEIRSQAETLMAHADEIERFVRERQSGVATTHA